MDDPKANVDALVENLTKQAEKIGLYLDGVTVAAADHEIAERMRQDPSLLAELLRDGERFLLVANFTVGDIAWSDKVQNPETYADDKAFRALVTDAPLDAVEEIQKRLKAGGELFEDE